MFLLLYLFRIDETGTIQLKQTYVGNKTEQKKKKENSISINVLFAEMELPDGEEGNGENRNASLATFGARSARGSRFVISKWRENFLVDKVRKLIDRT